MKYTIFKDNLEYDVSLDFVSGNRLSGEQN